MLGNPRESIDVSEVTDFSVNQRQQAKTEPSRRRGVRRVSRPLAASKKKRVTRKLRRAASPRRREERPTSVTKSYKRGRFGSSDIGIWASVSTIVSLGFLEFGLAKFGLGAEAFFPFWYALPSRGVNYRRGGRWGPEPGVAPVPEVGLYVKIKRSQFRSPESRPNQRHVNFS